MVHARIVALGTAVPSGVIRQNAVRDILASQPGLSHVAQRLITAAFDNSAIETRRTVVPDFASEAAADSTPGPGAADPDAGPEGPDGGGNPALFIDPATGELLHTSTGTRNAFYARESVPLALAAARDALAGAPVEPGDITHVITVSCTGFFAPGLDFELARRLGLRSDIKRLHVGFMGCHGAFPALRTAVEACRAAPDSVVLVVCVELCSLHFHSAESPDQIVSTAVFADGAGCAVVTARALPGLRIDAMHSELAPASEQEMTWTVGDEGFDLRLSSYVPRVLQAEIGGALAPLDPGVPWPDIDHWAIHPGGRAILDRVQQALELSDAQLEPSRGVLSRFGNMSSPTVLFILKELLAAAAPAERVVATAFGPGLTVESALLTVDGGPS